MFKNETTASQFEVVPGFEANRHVTMQGHFSKAVSDLNPDEALRLVNNGVNYIRFIDDLAAAEATEVVRENIPDAGNAGDAPVAEVVDDPQFDLGNHHDEFKEA